MRRCTPIWGAARPRPRASYIVSYMLSANATRLPLTSSTSRERCFRTGSPKTRTGWVATRASVPAAFFRPNGCSHPEGINVDAQATVFAGRSEIGPGERVAERVGGFRLHQRPGRRAGGDRTQHADRVHSPQHDARGVDRVGGAAQL